MQSDGAELPGRSCSEHGNQWTFVKGRFALRKSLRGSAQGFILVTISRDEQHVDMESAYSNDDLTEAGREYGVLDRTGSEFANILQRRAHAGRIKWLRQAMEQFTKVRGSRGSQPGWEPAVLCSYKTSQRFPLSK